MDRGEEEERYRFTKTVICEDLEKYGISSSNIKFDGDDGLFHFGEFKINPLDDGYTSNIISNITSYGSDFGFDQINHRRIFIIDYTNTECESKIISKTDDELYTETRRLKFLNGSDGLEFISYDSDGNNKGYINLGTAGDVEIQALTMEHFIIILYHIDNHILCVVYDCVTDEFKIRNGITDGSFSIIGVIDNDIYLSKIGYIEDRIYTYKITLSGLVCISNNRIDGCDLIYRCRHIRGDNLFIVYYNRINMVINWKIVNIMSGKSILIYRANHPRTLPTLEHDTVDTFFNKNNTIVAIVCMKTDIYFKCKDLKVTFVYLFTECERMYYPMFKNMGSKVFTLTELGSIALMNKLLHMPNEDDRKEYLKGITQDAYDNAKFIYEKLNVFML